MKVLGSLQWSFLPSQFHSWCNFQMGKWGLGTLHLSIGGKGLYSIVKNEMCRALLLAGYSSPNYDTSETAPPPSPESVFEFCGYRIKSFVLK